MWARGHLLSVARSVKNKVNGFNQMNTDSYILTRVCSLYLKKGSAPPLCMRGLKHFPRHCKSQHRSLAPDIAGASPSFPSKMWQPRRVLLIPMKRMLVHHKLLWTKYTCTSNPSYPNYIGGENQFTKEESYFLTITKNTSTKQLLQTVITPTKSKHIPN